MFKYVSDADRKDAVGVIPLNVFIVKVISLVMSHPPYVVKSTKSLSVTS